MISAKFYVKDINYNTIVDLAMPYIVKWLSEKGGFFYEILKGIISKKGKPTKFSKILVSLIPNKTDMASSILPHFDEILIEYLNSLMIKNNVVAKISSIKMNSIERGKETMLKIEIKVGEIDYEKTLEGILPLIMQKMSEKDDKSRKIVKILKSFNGLPNQVLKAALGAIPKEQRDEIVATILAEYKEDLMEVLNTMVASNNIKAEIFDIDIDSI